jgi:hypothetical protein
VPIEKRRLVLDEFAQKELTLFPRYRTPVLGCFGVEDAPGVVEEFVPRSARVANSTFVHSVQ